MRPVDADALLEKAWDVDTRIGYVIAVDVGDIYDAPTIDAIEVVRCKDCIYGYLYIDVQNGVTDSWIECRNPEGLNRDVSADGYCSASIRRT